MAVDTSHLNQSRYGWVADQLSALILRKTPRWWYTAVAFGGLGVCTFATALFMLFSTGIGVWGNTNPVYWAFDIINFVWWVGIGHAGTLISAVLFLVKQQWRVAIARFAEAMTVFAVAMAAMFPLIHLGRPWLFFWLFPYPNTFAIWPQFRSPLMWDVFAISTYATVSVVFWYVGMVPDLATMRDKAKKLWQKRIYGFFCLGWRNSATHWNRYEMAYMLLAGLATPLVVSVHSIVGMDFAAGIVPGWHVTMFPPYFVAGAVFSGFAMVLTLAIPLRKALKVENIITDYHIDTASKVMLATGLIVGYGYIIEVFFGWYSANEYEWYMVKNRMFGPYWWSYWSLILCNVILPQLLWIPKVRRNVFILWPLSIVINIGMWLERFVIIVTSLHRDFIPSSWGMFYPTVWDFATYLGTLGTFFFLFMMFLRFIPIAAIFEVAELIHKREHEGDDGH